MMKQFIIDVVYSQIIGDRSSQQDSIAIRTLKNDNNELNHLVAVICDGMGGYECGDVASNYVANKIATEYDFSENAIDYFERIVYESNEDVIEIINEMTDDGKGGTTLIGVIIKENKLTYINVGDSRLYILRGEDLIQISTDQNYYEKLLEDVEKQKISKETALAHPHKEYLTNYIGREQLDKIECFNEIELLANDLLILCSDGLYKSIVEKEIINILKEPTDLSQKTNILCAAAYDSCYQQDNTSVAIIKMEEKI